MSAQFFEELTIPVPDYNLDVGSGLGNSETSLHGAQTAAMLEGIERVLMKERPDWVIVYGDTNSTLAGALAAAKLGLPIAHVEAGLRSFNRTMPEEINRVVTDHLAQRLFCPTETARRHLSDEGIVRGVEVVGDVMYDLLLQVQPQLAARAQELLAGLHIEPRAYFLVTVHRPVNTDDPEAMRNIAQALNRLEMPVIFPIHPRTRTRMQTYAIDWGKHIAFIEPAGYVSMLALEQSAYRVITDSGGVQKESFLLGVPCVTLRAETEWPETVEAGWNTLVGSRWQAILEAANLSEPAPSRQHPFGEGDAALRIARSLALPDEGKG